MQRIFGTAWIYVGHESQVRNPGDYFLNETAHELGHRFGVHHATLQIETDPGIACPLEPDAVV